MDNAQHHYCIELNTNSFNDLHHLALFFVVREAVAEVSVNSCTRQCISASESGVGSRSMIRCNTKKEGLTVVR